MAIWKIITKDGKEASELTHKWNEVKYNIQDMALITNNNQVIKLPANMEKYIQFKSASSNLDGGNVQIDSRTLGFTLGIYTIKIKVNENNNNISIEVE